MITHTIAENIPCIIDCDEGDIPSSEFSGARRANVTCKLPTIQGYPRLSLKRGELVVEFAIHLLKPGFITLYRQTADKQQYQL